jgi:hypothetical protein
MGCADVIIKKIQEMKKLYTAGLGLGLLLFAASSCQTVSQEQQAAEEVVLQQAQPDVSLLHTSAQQLTNVIVYDIFKPPVASRIYAYSFLAAYEALQPQSAAYASLAGKLNDFEKGPQPEQGKEYDFSLASLKAFAVVGKTLTFSDNLWVEYEAEMERQFKAKVSSAEVYQRSLAYGEQVAAHVLAYANGDNYKKTRGYRHTLAHLPGSWEPTPPTYAEACEAKWNTIRSFTLDSVAQFAPAPPAVYDLKENSKFFKLVQEVYSINKGLTEEQQSIAYFWDDNPFVTNIVGHATFTDKKMTPAGHWIEIVRTVTQDKKLNMHEALEAYTLSSIALFDGFIACWDAKYKTDRVRPVTVINSTIDPDWMPFLETPAFPEYVSGHSTISAAAGRVLTHLLGDNVAFTDSTEHKYGHGVRSFTSFEQAYWETSMSRVYGGIHYRDGVEQGTYQGEKVGDWVWASLKEPEGTIADRTKKPAAVPTIKASAKQ